MWNWLYHAERCQMPCYWLKLFLPCCIFRNLQFVSDLASSVARHSKNQEFSFTYWSSSSILLQTKFIVKLWPNPGQIIEKDQTIDKYILHYLLLLSISPVSNLSFNRLSSSAASFFLLMVLSSTKEECFLQVSTSCFPVWLSSSPSLSPQTEIWSPPKTLRWTPNQPTGTFYRC